MELAWFVGVDWGSQTHHACVVDVAGKVVAERPFRHSGAGLTAMAKWLLSFASTAEEVGVAIEVPRGPVVESLMEHDFAVYSINPKQLGRFRDRMSPSGAKDDRRDARVLASALRTDRDCLRRLEPADPAIVELREWSRVGEELTRERVRLASRMRQQLWRYYPQFLAAVGDDVAAPWALDLWRHLPTPRAGQRARGVTLTKVLKQHRIKRIDATTLRERLREPAVKLAPGTVEAATTHVRLLVDASPCSTASFITRTSSSTDWCRSSPRLLRWMAPTHPRRTTQSRRPRRLTRRSCGRCPASAPGCWPRCLPRAATRCGGATTTRFAACAGWLRSRSARVGACSCSVAWRRTADSGTLSSIGLASPCSSIRSATASTGRCALAATVTVAPSARLLIAC